MQIILNPSVAERYKSSSQKIRVITESWASHEVYCPSCGTQINTFENNRPVADFFCPLCKEEYELKSKGGDFGTKVVDGAYEAAIKRLKSNQNPSLFLLNYHPKSYEVINFFVIPKYFFVPGIIEERKPLSKSARRAGWVGCNFMLAGIPEIGKVFYVKDKVIQPKTSVLELWQKSSFLKEETRVNERTWILDIMNCVDKIDKKEFLLADVYDFENLFYDKHPHNRHIRDKIRQQLQLLRDRGYLEFIGRGRYRKI